MATPISLSALKPPMPGPWPARGSTTTKGRRVRIDLDARRRNDAHQQVIHRPLQRPAIHHQLGLVVEDVWHRFGEMFAILVAALAHHVEEQHAALGRIRHVFKGGPEKTEGRAA